MFQWMFYVLVVSAALSVAGALAEQVLRQRRRATRAVWLLTLGLCVALALGALPSAVPAASVRTVAPIHLPLLTTTLRTVSPRRLYELGSSMQAIWLGLSGLVLLGLVGSALQVYVRRRRWPMRLVETHCVGISSGVGPAVIGLIRATIVLPDWVLARTPDEQRLIVAHEASHLMARDPLSLTLAVVAVLLLPWNPFLWWQLHRLRHAIEVDCDARVLGAGHDLLRYGETLIEVGRRKSQYLGTVAAMSENRTLLEKRIEIMSQRTRRPWTLGLAAVAALSLSVALAATQVTTPPPGTATELPLDAATLDRYVGHYQLTPTSVLSIVRNGPRLNATITGQPTFAIYADSPTEFHWQVVQASVTFSGDANGSAAKATIHQNGNDVTALRIDDNAVAQAQRQLEDRIAAHQPQPGTEAALRKTLTAMISGKPNYGDMTETLQTAVRNQSPASDAMFAKAGAVQTVEFRGVSEAGADKYLVTHQSGKQTQWLIQLGSDGRIAILAGMPVF